MSTAGYVSDDENNQEASDSNCDRVTMLDLAGVR